MSFEPIVFQYIPPPTVSAPIPPATAQPSVSNTTSNAATLIKRFADLQAAANYLISAILAMNQNTGITVNVAANPAFDLAFKAINGLDGSTTTPTVIPISLYNQYLTAQVVSMQIQSTLGTDSANDLNLAQAANLNSLVTAIEDSLLENATFQAEVPLALRGLATDSMIFSSFQTSLGAYPVITNAGSVDVSPELNDTMNSIADRVTSNYQDLNSVLSGVGPVASDTANVSNTMSAQPIADIVRLVSLLNGSRALLYKGSFKDIAKDIANFSVAQLCCDLGGMACMADRFTQSVLSPITGMTGPLGDIIKNGLNISSTLGSIPSGPMAGLPTINTCSNGTAGMPGIQSAAAVTAAQQAQQDILKASTAIANYSAGLMSLEEQASLAINKVTEKLQNKIKQFNRAMDRKISNQASLTQSLCAIRSLDGLVSLGMSLISGSSNSTAANAANAVAGAITSGAISMTAPVLPPVPASISHVLIRT